VCAPRARAPTACSRPGPGLDDQANKLAGGGHCYGFSLVSLKFFDKLLSPLDYGGPSPRGLTLQGNLALQRRLAEAWAVQMSPQVLLADYLGTPTRCSTS